VVRLRKAREALQDLRSEFAGGALAGGALAGATH
jgi:hypothetical protein